MPLQLFRGSILHCLQDPGDSLHSRDAPYFEDGGLLVAEGRVQAVGSYSDFQSSFTEDTEVIDYSGKLIVPGFVDTHIHFVQTDIIASYGEQLLSWLEKYTFPAERAFADNEHAIAVAEFFIEELLRNGTTTALVLGSVHPQSVDAIFSAAQRKKMRLIAGKVLMDRNCPECLRDTPETGYSESRELIERWHHEARLSYAITPRFALTSSPQQLQRSAELAAEYPDVYVHTHLAENRAEVAEVAKLFPEARSYLDVYDRYGLLRDRSMYAHGIHLDADDRKRLAETGASVAFCPSCNLFIGSGLFDLKTAWEFGIRVGLGTDVGGGPTFNMLQVLCDAYKVAQLNSFSLSPYRALYLATLAGAEALRIDDRIGNFAAGKEADFIVLDPGATPLLQRRTSLTDDITDKLFALIMLGDDRAVWATHLMGNRVMLGT
ncbi:MAG: guanine deaminase [Gammaproteobacteria bacterium]|nr:guanine deaminase [Gammaproteobacteria bacterium]MDH3467949.1 guanine deaminase [Gammaproteobacteria bacterium]